VRILHIDTGREMRGGQRQVLLLMKGLREAGHESVLLARREAALWNCASVEGFAVYAARLTEVWRHSGGVDLTHAHDARAHTLAALGAGKKFVVSRRVAFPVRRSVGSRWKYGRAARYLAVSRFVAEQLEAAGVPRGKIDVVFDGVETCGAAGEWKRQHPAVALASTDPEKGRDLVERAAAAATIPVVYSSDLAEDLQRASMFVYLTRSEGLGSAALLAMSMGVPVIASDVGGLAEVVIDGESGMLVKNDAGEIARAMGRMLEEDGLAQGLIRNARRRVEKFFSLDQLVENTLEVYRRALG
jgi:glycosyltransferase involved in cell wall biosynthesis